MFDLEKFKTGEYFIHTDTLDKFKKVLDTLHNEGLSFIGGERLISSSYVWFIQEENTTVGLKEGKVVLRPLSLSQTFYDELAVENNKEVVNKKINLEGNNELLADNASRYTKLMLENKSVYLDKNEKYGDAFAETIQKYGYISALTRMNDKFNRIEEFTLKGFQDEEESLRDSLMDLANYCYMYVMEIEKEQGICVKNNLK